MVFNLPLTERNLVITGYIEPNKPRIARQVAERLRMPFVDMEARIEERFGEDINTIRNSYGERRLKTVEAEIMEEILLYRNAVLRINGSTLMHSEHYERMQSNSIMLCLVARLDAILQRMHLTLGARYHDPAERGRELSHLRREWAIRKKPNLLELDVTYKAEPAMITDIISLWQAEAM